MKPCQEYQAFWERYIANLRAYGIAVADMEAAVNFADFFPAFERAEECRERLLDARAALDEHTAGHGCYLTADFERLSKNRSCRGRTAPAASEGKRKSLSKSAGK